MSMTITRSRGETRRSTELATIIAGMGTPCVGCEGCRGLCRALIEAITLPDTILSDTRD